MNRAASDPLSRSDTAAAARRARGSYRRVLFVVLAAESAAGLALLLFPLSASRLLGLGAVEDAWPRLAGLLLLVLAALLAVGSGFPDRAKLTNLIGLVGRFVLALLLLLLGAGLLWAGLFELLATLVLASLYFSFFRAELMSRP
ncbi:MAG: hypothetical protein ACFBQW_09500 [Sphingomonadaceae bacterium]